MTTIVSTATTKKEEPPPYVPDWQQAQMPPTGPMALPLFIISDPRDIDNIVETTGKKHFFVLANCLYTNSKTGAQNLKWTEPRLWRYSANDIFEGLTIVEDGARTALPTVGERFNWMLPLIPIDLINRINFFFREMYKEHGTESIVILTYDRALADSENPSDGWGAIAPDQENTAAHCKYDPTSIAGELSDTVIQVGSAHSHPCMSAFASGTDSHDQVDWDGVHITFGWKSGQSATEYHIELQINNERKTFSPDDVFVGYEEEKFDVKEWSERVSKALPPAPKTAGGNSWATPGSSGPKGAGASSSSGPSSTLTPNNHHLNSGFPLAMRKDLNSKKPNGCPDLVDQVVVVELKTAAEANCPICESPLDDWTRIANRCSSCFHYILNPGESLKELLETRKGITSDSEMLFMPGLEFLVEKESVESVVVWRRAGETPSVQTVYSVEEVKPDPKVLTTTTTGTKTN